MAYNPYSDETIRTRAEINPPLPPMDGLQPKQQPQVFPVQQTPVTEVPSGVPTEPVESPEIRQQRKAMTAKFVIGKFNDYLVWFLTVLETMLALRFLLKLIGADPGNLFAGFLYAVTGILLLPFLNIVPSPTIHQNASFEFSTLIGMLVYFLIFYALRRFVHLLISTPEDDAASS